MAVKAKAVAQFVYEGRTILPGEELVMDAEAYARHLAVSDVVYVEDTDEEAILTPATPAEEVPVDPVEEAPVEPAPAEEAPVAPVEEAPADESQG